MLEINILPIFRETGAFPAPPTTIFPIQIDGIGNGFSTLRMFRILVPNLKRREKGYKVLVIEKGKRFHTEDFPKTNWNIRKYL